MVGGSWGRCAPRVKRACLSRPQGSHPPATLPGGDGWAAAQAAVADRNRSNAERAAPEAMDSAAIAAPAPAADDPQDTPPPHRLEDGTWQMDLLSPLYTVDREYRSMTGPWSTRTVQLGSADELVWVLGYSATMAGPDGITVMAGGNGRVLADGDDPRRPTARLAKDVWVLGADRAVPHAVAPLPQVDLVSSVPTRAADAMFWLGRAAQRAEAVAKTARVIASRAAARIAPAFASHSRCSAAGSLSATIPAPAWT